MPQYVQDGDRQVPVTYVRVVGPSYQEWRSAWTAMISLPIACVAMYFLWPYVSGFLAILAFVGSYLVSGMLILTIGNWIAILLSAAFVYKLYQHYGIASDEFWGFSIMGSLLIAAVFAGSGRLLPKRRKKPADDEVAQTENQP
jgi:hypothetical protein